MTASEVVRVLFFTNPDGYIGSLVFEDGRLEVRALDPERIQRLTPAKAMTEDGRLLGREGGLDFLEALQWAFRAPEYAMVTEPVEESRWQVVAERIQRDRWRAGLADGPDPKFGPEFVEPLRPKPGLAG